MGERGKPPSEHEETIAAFDREREQAHELNRRHQEMIENSRRNDRVVIARNDDDRDR